MKKIFLLLFLSFSLNSVFAQIEGTWRIAPQAGSLAVGPAQGDYSWWSNTDVTVTERACLFDDEFVFNDDGTFMNVQQGDTWLEAWQGVDPDACGAPLAPHDGSNAATWAYDAGAGTVTLTGVGAHVGLPKVINGGELAAPGDAPASITYPVAFSADGNFATIELDVGFGWWKFVLAKDGAVVDPPTGGVEGTWKIAAQAGSLAVGPAQGDYSWWSSMDATATERACLYDDEFVFNADGSFMNVQQGDTWLEAWQGVDPDACGAPLAPHDGSNAATWAYDEAAGTVTLTGVGAHLGLPKVINGGEISNPADAPTSITYPVTFSEGGNIMTIEIDVSFGWWKFVLAKDGAVVDPPTGSFEAGIWQISSQSGSLAVGPAQGDYSWWSSTDATPGERACLFDDQFVFHDDGTFMNVQQDETWLEAWQGVDPEACGAPIAPHDGSNAASWTFDEEAGTITLTGTGAHLGLAKVINGGELAAPGDAPMSITYPVAFSNNGNTMTIELDVSFGWWKFILERTGDVVDPPMSGDMTGTWIVAPEAGALAVGPTLGDFSWWSNDEASLTTRACFFDDKYVFGEDGTFMNVQQNETWLEPWQGVTEEQCGTPIAPHDGSNPATWSYDEDAGTVTLTGVGAYLAIPKVTDAGELSNPGEAPASITYPVNFSEGGDRVTIDIDYGGGFWHFVLIRDESVPVVEVKEDLFSFFPNPAQSTIQVNSAQQMDEYTIRDITGKVMLVKNTPQLNETIDVSVLARGVYLLESRAGNQLSVKKLVIQ